MQGRILAHQGGCGRPGPLSSPSPLSATETRMKNALLCLGVGLLSAPALSAESGDGMREFLGQRAARDAEVAKTIWNWAEVG